MAQDNPYLFDISDEANILKCYNDHGVVVVKNVLTKAECKETFVDLDLPSGCDITKPETYELMDNCVNRYGVYGNNPLFTKALLRNRTHQNVQKVFKLLYGTSAGPLLAQHDRIGIMRPITGTYGKEKWRVPDIHPNLHLDVDLFGYFADNYRPEVDNFLGNLDYENLSDYVAENNAKHVTMGRQIQAVLNFVDNRYEDGGFQCIPLDNPTEVLKNWVKDHVVESKPSPNGRYIFSNNSYDSKLLCQGEALRMPCPAGSLICFDATLPHGTLPNSSDRIRVIQFLRYIPESVIVSHKKRAKRVKQECERVGFEIDKANVEVLLGTKS
jgi:hypothetical protein